MQASNKLRDAIAVMVVGLGSFVLSTIWYSPFLFGSVWGEGEQSFDSVPAWSFAVAPLREIVSAALVLFLLRRTGSLDPVRAVGLALVLWFGFYVVQLSGAVIWDAMPWQLGAVHAGDWLMKMVVMASALSAWERRSRRRARRVEASAA